MNRTEHVNSHLFEQEFLPVTSSTVCSCGLFLANATEKKNELCGKGWEVFSVVLPPPPPHHRAVQAQAAARPSIRLAAVQQHQ